MGARTRTSLPPPESNLLLGSSAKRKNPGASYGTGVFSHVLGLGSGPDLYGEEVHHSLAHGYPDLEDAFTEFGGVHCYLVVEKAGEAAAPHGFT